MEVIELDEAAAFGWQLQQQAQREQHEHYHRHHHGLLVGHIESSPGGNSKRMLAEEVVEIDNVVPVKREQYMKFTRHKKIRTRCVR